jgi:uncharacterized protein YndB with AHSA1/START domain
MKNATKPEGIVIERTYQAELQELWDLWTTKDGFESWWGPQGFRVEVHNLQQAVRGELHYTMIAAAPEMIEAMQKMGQPTSHPVRARFLIYSPMSALAITSLIDFLPGVEAYESKIEVQFTPTAGGVRMTVTLHAMHDAEFTRMQREGFTSQLSKLDQRFLAS